MFLKTNFEEDMRGSIVRQPAHHARVYSKATRHARLCTRATRAYMYARPAGHNTRAYARDANRDSHACLQNLKIAK